MYDLPKKNTSERKIQIGQDNSVFVVSILGGFRSQL